MEEKKYALVLGGNGFVGKELIKKLKEDNYFVRAVDLFEDKETIADEYFVVDLRDIKHCTQVLLCPKQNKFCMAKEGWTIPLRKENNYFEDGFDEVYQLAYDDRDGFDINSTTININIAQLAKQYMVKKLLYVSNVGENAEKAYNENIYLNQIEKFGLNAKILRLPNIIGENCNWRDGNISDLVRLCIEVASELKDKAEIDFTFKKPKSNYMDISDAIKAIRAIIDSDIKEPLDVYNKQSFSNAKIADVVLGITDKNIKLKELPEETYYNMLDNLNMGNEKLNFVAEVSITDCIYRTYKYIDESIKAIRKDIAEKQAKLVQKNIEITETKVVDINTTLKSQEEIDKLKSNE